MLAGLFCLFGWLLVLLQLQLIFSSVSLQLGLAKLVLFMVFTQLSTAIPSMPASLGVYHSVAVACLSYLGVEYNLSLVIAIASHGIAILVQVFGGLISQLFNIYKASKINSLSGVV